MSPTDQHSLRAPTSEIVNDTVASAALAAETGSTSDADPPAAAPSKSEELPTHWQAGCEGVPLASQEHAWEDPRTEYGYPHLTRTPQGQRVCVREKRTEETRRERTRLARNGTFATGVPARSEAESTLGALIAKETRPVASPTSDHSPVVPSDPGAKQTLKALDEDRSLKLAVPELPPTDAHESSRASPPGMSCAGSASSYPTHTLASFSLAATSPLSASPVPVMLTTMVWCTDGAVGVKDTDVAVGGGMLSFPRPRDVYAGGEVSSDQQRSSGCVATAAMVNGNTPLSPPSAVLASRTPAPPATQSPLKTPQVLAWESASRRQSSVSLSRTNRLEGEAMNPLPVTVTDKTVFETPVFGMKLVTWIGATLSVVSPTRA
eukprot:210779-Rhodomonas_salina.3